MTERIVRHGERHVRLGPGESPDGNGFEEVPLESAPGVLTDGRYYPSAAAGSGMIWVGGVGGGWDTPAFHLYPRLAAELTGHGVASLRIRFRLPGDLGECVRDVLAGIAFLERHGIESVGLAGWSFGGTVVLQAGARSPVVRTVVTFATQSYGAEAVARLSQDCSVLLLHGTIDGVLPSWCSIQVHQMAHEPKELVLFEGADHGLEEAADEVYGTTKRWVIEKLGSR